MINPQIIFFLIFLVLFPPELKSLEEMVLPYSSPLFIPPLLEDLNPKTPEMDWKLEVKAGVWNYFKDIQMPTLGYNGNYLGPTLRVKRKQQVNVVVENHLDEESGVYLHGLQVPRESSYQVIAPKGKWETSFMVDQQASTLWYHPQVPGKTGEQIYKGLAGLLLVDDAYEETLDLPRDYGVDDIPLVLQDVYLDEYGYFVSPQNTQFHEQNLPLVNGVPYPVFEVRSKLVRLRILNASPSSIYRISVSGETLTMIASDGGLLPRRVTKRNFVLSPGERGEFLLDLSHMDQGEDRNFVMEKLGSQIHRALRFHMLPELEGGTSSKSLKIETLDQAMIPVIEIPPTKKRRSFVLKTNNNQHTINGQTIKENRINERIKQGDTEIWEISHAGDMSIPHSFHIQGFPFYIVERNAMPPEAEEAGPKDTVLIWPGDRVKIAVTFAPYSGKFFYQCQILPHGDRGMMGQFLVSER